MRKSSPSSLVGSIFESSLCCLALSTAPAEGSGLRFFGGKIEATGTVRF